MYCSKTNKGLGFRVNNASLRIKAALHPTVDFKDEHKDWKPLNLEIMRRFTLVGLAMEFGNLPRGN